MKETMSRTRILVEGAMMVALAYVLSSIPIYELPLGGSVTLCAILPILVFSLRHSFKWGLAVAGVYAVLQLLQGLKNFSYLKSLYAVVLCALLDYLIAYACVSLAGPIARRFQNSTLGITVATLSVGLLRFACSFLSGLIIWTEYVGEGYTVLTWSLSYNGSWAAVDTAIVLVAILAVSRVPALGLTKKAKPA